MYATETKVFIALLTGTIVQVILMAFFVITIVRYQRKKSSVDHQKIKEEFKVLDREKARISKDLHDDLGSTLAIIEGNLELLLKNEPEKKDSILKLKNLLAEAMGKLRATAYSLLPPVLQRSGIEAALRVLTEEVASSSNIEINFISSIDQISSDIELHIYRIVQEALANILKHSNATRVSISLVRIKDILELYIKDNGIGFQLEEIATYSGLGLHNILSRANILNAKLYLNTAPQKGVDLLFEIPAYGKNQNYNSR